MPVTSPREPKALLKVGYACNNACLFCHSSPHRGREATFSEVARKLHICRDRGVQTVVLSGGEPTIRKDLDALAAEIRRLGLGFGLVSNGRMLAYPALRRQLLASGLRYLQVSLAGGRSETHDRLVRVEGGFDQTVSGLRALIEEARSAAGFASSDGEPAELVITINGVATRPLLSEIDLWLKLCADLARGESPNGVRIRAKLSALEPEGSALRNLGLILTPISRAGAVVADALDRHRPKLEAAGIELGIEGFPHCVVGPAFTAEMDLWSDGFVFMSEAFENELHPIDDEHRVRPSLCMGCSRDGCAGLYETYVHQRGSGELRPTSTLRSNSFVFEPIGEIPVSGRRETGEERCPLEAAGSHLPDPRRELAFSDGERWILWRTESGDFTERELHETKNAKQQIYLHDPTGRDQVGGRRRLGPHGSGTMTKLRVADCCRSCSSSECCGRAFVEVEATADPFETDRRTIMQLVAGCRGSVLDVGCGSVPYLRSLRFGLSSGETRYCGADISPDLSGRGVEGLRAVKVSAESLPFCDDSFDVVLSIRSFPHFPHPSRAVEEMARVARPAGRVEVVTDVAYGVLRLSPLETGSAGADGFQHYRNLSVGEVRRAMELAGLDIVSVREVSPSTTNLGFISAVKPASS
jgi:SAM-dependent methyltransferase